MTQELISIKAIDVQVGDKLHSIKGVYQFTVTKIEIIENDPAETLSKRLDKMVIWGEDEGETFKTFIKQSNRYKVAR